MASNNINQDGLHSTDVDRLKSLRDIGAEEFTIRWQHADRMLILKVNGVERNRIVVDNPESKFETCLRWMKDQFIAWRSLKN